MKRIISTLALAITATAAFSQACVINAYNAMESGDYEKAATYIDECQGNEKAETKDKTWRYRGQIYQAISINPELRQKFPNSEAKAVEAFMKAKELDVRGSYADLHNNGLRNMQAIALNNGVENFTNKNYDVAIARFDLAEKISTHFGAMDSLGMMAIYNKGLVNEINNNGDAAIESYRRCIELGYNPEDVYNSIIRIYRLADRNDEALEVIREARTKFPENQEFIVAETDIILQSGNFEAALGNLQKAIEKDPGNEILQFNLGVVHDNLGNFDDAKTAYAKAIELNGEYFDAYFNMGAMYYNKAADKINACNEIPANQMKQYDACKKEADAIFTEALPYFEKAHELMPDDRSTMSSLSNIYARVGMDAKYLEMKNKLGE